MTRPIVQKDWTAHEAIAAHEDFTAAGGDGLDPLGPFFQWAALHTIDEYQKRFEDGDKHALMIALRECAQHQIVMPAWVQAAYIEGFDAVNNYRAKSWDDVFGQNVPKGKHLAALRKARVGRVWVLFEVHEATQRGEPINRDLFERIGKKHNLGVTLVEQYYYGKERPAARRTQSQSRKK